MWDFSPLTKDWTHIPHIARQILNHWTSREVPKCLLIIALEYKHCSPLLETTAPFFSFGSYNILDIEAAAQVNRELMDVLCLVQGSIFYLWSLELMEPKPGLGRTEPVSHSTFTNHKREHAAQERPAGAEFCFVKTRYRRMWGSVHWEMKCFGRWLLLLSSSLPFHVLFRDSVKSAVLFHRFSQ